MFHHNEVLPAVVTAMDENILHEGTAAQGFWEVGGWGLGVGVGVLVASRPG